MAEEEADSPNGTKRWTAKRRSALVLSILRGETSVAQAARQHALTVAEIEEWKERFLTAAENGLRSRPLDDEALKDTRKGVQNQFLVQTRRHGPAHDPRREQVQYHCQVQPTLARPKVGNICRPALIGLRGAETLVQ